MSFLKKIRGDSSAVPPRAPVSVIILTALGGFLAIASTTFFSQHLGTALVLGSFGSSSALIFGYSDSPFSQPRNFVLGHVVSTLIGLFFLKNVGAEWWSVSSSVSAAIAAMLLLRIMHPPAASNPLIVFALQPGWDFALFPTLAGTLLITLVAVVYLNATRKSHWPLYW